MLLPATIHRVLVRETDQTFLVELRETDGQRRLPISIGPVEATAIMRALTGELPPRPMTHDLLFLAVSALGGHVERVAVVACQDGVFFARIHLRQQGKIIDLDARPSDAIALAAATKAGIFVEEDVWEG